MIVYHGGTDAVKIPVIKLQTTGRDFGKGFYCTDVKDQAEKWATRQGRVRKQPAVLNIYEFDIDYARMNLNLKMYIDYSTEWLEMVVNCRREPQYTHGFDIVYGKIANDDVGETVQAVMDGLMPLDFALKKLTFMPSNNQYCFCNEKSLAQLIYKESKNLVE